MTPRRRRPLAEFRNLRLRCPLGTRQKTAFAAAAATLHDFLGYFLAVTAGTTSRAALYLGSTIFARQPTVYATLLTGARRGGSGVCESYCSLALPVCPIGTSCVSLSLVPFADVGNCD